MLRLASNNDLGTLQAIEEVCFEHDKIDLNEFKKHLKNDRSRVVIEHENTEQNIMSPARGYYISIYLPTSKRCRLYSAAVLPEYRRKGILSSFLRDFEGDALNKGMEELFLEVETDNEQAISVYRKHGFTEYGIFPKYYENDKDALRMKKLLTNG